MIAAPERGPRALSSESAGQGFSLVSSEQAGVGRASGPPSSRSGAPSPFTSPAATACRETVSPAPGPAILKPPSPIDARSRDVSVAVPYSTYVAPDSWRESGDAVGEE